MLNVLLYLSTGLIIFVFIFYMLLVLFSKNNDLDNTGFDISNELLSSYDGIKIIFSKGLFSYYDIKRKIIKLNQKCYYGKSISDISISLIETGSFISDSKGNKFIELCRKIIPSLKILYILPIVSVFISCSTYSINDSKLSMFIILLFVILHFSIINLKKETQDLILEQKIELKNKIMSFVKLLISLDYLILFGYILMMFRFVMIIFNINI